MATSQITAGNVQITALLDVRTSPQPGVMFKSVEASDWDQYRQLYPWAFNPENGNLVSNASSFLVRSQGRTILVDLGLGEGPHQNAGGAMGQLLDSLAEAGVSPNDVDTILITHMHGDHIGWATRTQDGARVPTFPNARIYIGAKDWEFFTAADHPQSAALQATLVPLHAAGKVELVSSEVKVTDEVTVLPMAGHTPGHQVVLVKSGDEGVLFPGDCVHSPAQIAETDWSPVFDWNADDAADARWTVVQRADVEKLVLAAGHFPFPCFGRITRIEGRRGFERLFAE